MAERGEGILGGIRLRFIALIASACVVGALFCHVAAAQVDGTLSGDEAGVVKARVEKIRGLKFTADVPVTYLGVEATKARFTAKFAREVSEQEIEVGIEENKLIGLLPPDLEFGRKDLADMAIELPAQYRNAVTGMLKLETAGVLGHELTHALQDQHFGMGATLQKYKGNTDRTLAYKAVVEGDATLSGFSVVTGRVDDQTIDYFDTHLQDIVPVFMGRMEDKPRAMTYPFIFQY